MLTCIARSKQLQHKSLDDDGSKATDASKGGSEPLDNGQPLSTKSVTSQFREIAVKASGAYLQCTPCTGPVTNPIKSIEASELERFRWPSLRRTVSSNSASQRIGWGKELEARLKGISSSSGEITSSSFVGSGRRVDPPVVFVEEKLPKEWVAQVEPGVLITFVSLQEGWNDLKRIRFSKNMFNKWQAQRWWAENYEKVMELYNVQRLNRHTFPLPTIPSEDENAKVESNENSPASQPLMRILNRPPGLMVGNWSPDSADQPTTSTALTSTPNHSSISGTKTESPSIDSIRSSSSRDLDRSEYFENEWVEEDEPGVFITIRALPSGKRELRRVRFSRERFGEVHARLWWEDNRARVHERYL